MNLLENKMVRGTLFLILGVFLILVLSISGSKVITPEAPPNKGYRGTKKVVDTLISKYPTINPRDLYNTDNY